MHLESAQAALGEFPPNIERAVASFRLGLQEDENSVELLCQFGELMANLGDTEAAVPLLEKSIKLQPKARAYFYLGQMRSGAEALASYEKCVEFTKREIQLQMSDDDLSDQLISSLCLIADLYMTDLCDEPQAEGVCESVLQEALSLNADSFEALTSLATFHKIRMELDTAKQFCLRAAQLVDAFVQTGEEVEIPFGNRMRLAENLVDLELTEEALSVLATLLAEDEEDVQAWFLTAACHLVTKERDEAAECVRETKKILKKNPHLRIHWTKNLIDLEARIAALPRPHA